MAEENDDPRAPMIARCNCGAEFSMSGDAPTVNAALDAFFAEHFAHRTTKPPLAAPQWTLEPPKSAGFYWIRLKGGSLKIVSRGEQAEWFTGENWAWQVDANAAGFEFWPIPIEPPKG